MNANNLSNNSVEESAPVGKKIILNINPVVIAYATALIHLENWLSFLILLDKRTPKNLQRKIPNAAVRRSIQGIKSVFVVNFSIILFICCLNFMGE